MFFRQYNLRQKNLYQVLQVSRLSSHEEIRASYLTLVKKFHPDVSDSLTVGESSSFREVQEAYTTLGNTWKRTLYDQDLQFSTAAAEVGGWRANFEAETAEARIARRERYKRYARGERNDLPPVALTTRASLTGLFLLGGLLTWVCAKAPEWFGGQGEQTYHDPVSDDKSVPLVRAFFNPITKVWERLAIDQSPPSPAQLINVYKSQSPGVVDRWERREPEIANALDSLTVANVPKTKSVVATVAVSEDKLHVNRRSINEVMGKFT